MVDQRPRCTYLFKRAKSVALNALACARFHEKRISNGWLSHDGKYPARTDYHTPGKLEDQSAVEGEEAENLLNELAITLVTVTVDRHP